MFDEEIFAKERKSCVANVYTDSSSQSYKHMIYVLITLAADKDVVDSHKLISLKQAKKSNNWLK